MTCEERFLKYVSFDTSASFYSGESPSTAKQLNLSRALEEEMNALGLLGVHIDTCGNVIGTLPATEGVKAPVVAFIAHVDTSPEASDENVKTRKVVFTGEDIELGNGVMLSEKEFPAMKTLHGKELIVTDGSTLLGADDKAGVAEIMTMVADLVESGKPHGELRIIFTTDEEIGNGVDGLSVEELGCAWGYTVDGGALGGYEYENFNAASAKVTLHGIGIHTGSAKNIMKNAAAIGCKFHSLLPADLVPEKTEGYEGFIHLNDIEGDVVDCTMHYILRDHDIELLQEKKRIMLEAAEKIRAIYGAEVIELELHDTYYNMKEKILPHMHLIDRVENAYRACGVEPYAEAIRGGTDGARLTWDGLPCPNLSTGGYNFHGVHEFIPTEALRIMPQMLTVLAQSFIE